MLRVCEIFTTIQGESSFSGLPCRFVRLAGCNLHCRWCDTPYARTGGEERKLEEVAVELTTPGGPGLVTVTGGEPLLQEETPRLVKILIESGSTVTVETNGSLPIDVLDPRCHRIVDLKPPSSGESGKILWRNLDLLSVRDELKIVIAHEEDYRWAKSLIESDRRLEKVLVNLSPAAGLFSGRELAERILADGLRVRLNLQIHKILWPEESRGR